MTYVGKHDPIEVLLVEDNPGDVRLTREAFESAANYCRISVVSDGEEALAYLRRQGKYREAPSTDLVLLDLNLPKVDGQEVLRNVKGDRTLASIPVIVFTSSDALSDISAVYALHANSYVTKPKDLDEFLDLAENIKAFWFRAAKLPTRHGLVQ